MPPGGSFAHIGPGREVEPTGTYKFVGSLDHIAPAKIGPQAPEPSLMLGRRQPSPDGADFDRDYAGGGPTYVLGDLRWGNKPILLHLYHGEYQPDYPLGRVYGGSGMAISNDYGDTFIKIGQILGPHISRQEFFESGLPGGIFADGFLTEADVSGNRLRNGNTDSAGVYYYLIFADRGSVREHPGFAIARAGKTDVLEAISQRKAPRFRRYSVPPGANQDPDLFTEPGIGGNFTAIVSQNDYIAQPQVIYNAYLQKFILSYMVNQRSIMFRIGDNLFHWGEPITVLPPPQEANDKIFYPSLVGSGSDPAAFGKTFFLYFLQRTEVPDRGHDSPGFFRTTITLGGYGCILTILRLSYEEARQNLRTNRHGLWMRMSSPEVLAPEPEPNEARARIHDSFARVYGNALRRLSERRFFAIGSCFARLIENLLVMRGIAVPSRDVTPYRAAPELFRPPRDVQGIAGFLSRYNVPSMRQEIDILANGFPPPERNWLLYQNGEKWVDLHYADLLTNVALAECHARRAIVQSHLGRALRDANTFVITLGLCEAWYDVEAQAFLNVTPPPRVTAAAPGRFELHFLDYDDNLRAITGIYDTLCTIKGAEEFEIIVTVSPVPLGATFTSSDIVVANAEAKAILRAVAGEAARRFREVTYFPSYEIAINSNPADAWERDRLHVQKSLGEHIVATFLDLLGASG